MKSIKSWFQHLLLPPHAKFLTTSWSQADEDVRQCVFKWNFKKIVFISLELHPGLFFSNRPALNDQLGQAIDSGSVTLSCVGGSRGNNRVYFKWYKDGQLLQADRSPIVATIQGDLNINPSDYSRDNGQYQCLITDNTFSLLSNMAELQLACKLKSTLSWDLGTKSFYTQ